MKLNDLLTEQRSGEDCAKLVRAIRSCEKSLTGMVDHSPDNYLLPKDERFIKKLEAKPAIPEDKATYRQLVGILKNVLKDADLWGANDDQWSDELDAAEEVLRELGETPPKRRH